MCNDTIGDLAPAPDGEYRIVENRTLYRTDADRGDVCLQYLDVRSHRGLGGRGIRRGQPCLRAVFSDFFRGGQDMSIFSAVARLWLLSVLVALAGCASLGADMDPPKVTLESFRALPSTGGSPRFEIKLRVINPNKQSLDIAGISYSVELRGKELISGVSNEVPLIEGYSEEVVTLEAGLQLFQLLRLVTSLGSTPSDTFEYRFLAKIDFNGFVPTQRVEETGEIKLQ